MLSSKKNRTSTEKKIFEASAKVLIVLIGLLTTNSSSWSATLAAAPHETTSSLSGIRLTQQSVTVGDITILEIDILNQKILVKGLSARFLDLVIPLVDHPTIGPNTLIGLIPVPYQTTPGIANISVDWTDSTGHHNQPIPVEIRNGEFQSENLKVTASRVTPPKKAMKRIQRERKEIKAAYSHSQPLRYWDGPFQRPTIGKVTSPYGAQRLLNGQLQRFHSGVDFRAAIGTPIYAANRGVVRLAKNLFYSGNHVILDHGEGLFTSYSHLNRIDVHTGQSVDKGQVIGKSGATGRVSGPHLHWSVKIHGVNVDPLGFTRTLDALFADQNSSNFAIPQSPKIRSTTLIPGSVPKFGK